MSKKWLILAAIVILITLFIPQAFAADVPYINLDIGQADTPEKVSSLIRILFVLTVLSLAPSILIMMTSFIRLTIVFSFLRQAMGTMQAPSNQIIVGLALFLTFFIMSPVLTEINSTALKPYLDGAISQETALATASKPIKAFMLKQTREADLALFVSIAKQPRPKNKEDVALLTLTPAYIISELKTAFTIGFIIYLPFLVIDMVVASVLLAMGMMMLPPIMISLPFKLILFVLVDGWNLLIGSLVRSFG